MYNPFETLQSDEINPTEYELYFEHFRSNVLPEVDKTPKIKCPKCGEMITYLEITLSHGRCPCCDSIISKEEDISI